MISARRTLAVAHKELRHLLRDPRMWPVLFVMPVLQLVVLGLAANLDVVDLRLVVLDLDRSPVSRALVERLDASFAFTVVGVSGDPAQAERALDAGTAELVLVVPAGTARRLVRVEQAPLPVWVDGTDTNRALLAQEQLARVVERVSHDALPARALPAHVQPRVRVLFNPALQSRWFMLPAIVVMVLAVLTMTLSAMAVVKERERGTIEQLVVTPIRPVELILGKLIPFVGVGLVIAALVSVAAVGIFGVPFVGSPLALLGFSLLFLMSTLGLGLLISTVSGTQQQAMLASVLVLMPSFMLGGMFFPVTNMPEWAQRIADLIPVRYFAVMVRGVFLKGTGPGDMVGESAALAGIGAVVLGVAVLQFRKRSA